MSASLLVSSPVGPLVLREENGRIVGLDWGNRGRGGRPTRAASRPGSPLLRRAATHLAQYFAGRRRAFDLPLDPSGTAFQKSVWETMRRIPFGATRTYGELARALDTSPRAVGQACGRNPIAILIPCHRVVGSAGGLGGYSGRGGIATKKLLLSLEGAARPGRRRQRRETAKRRA
jgi:methylated-DNA-[protein]-cysteine S-methyltransferase